MASVTSPIGAEASPAYPAVHEIGTADLFDFLARGVADFDGKPSHLVLLALIHPLVALMLARLTFGYDVVPLRFPPAAGLALVDPAAAIGPHELSRRSQR